MRGRASSWACGLLLLVAAPSAPAHVAADRASSGPPSCNPVSSTTPRDTSVVVQLSCTGGNGPLALSIVDQPDNGTLGAIDQATDRVTYTPAAGFIGTDTFHYRANDGSADSPSAMVTLTVTNRPPVAGFTFAPATPRAGEAITFTSTSTDPDGDVDTVDWDFDGDGQFDDDSGSEVTRSLTAGTNTVRVRATDTDGATATAEQNVVVSQNAVPVCDAKSVTTLRNEPVEVQLTCSDDGDPLTLSIVSQPAHGDPVTIDPATNRVTYQPNQGYRGADSFRYLATDGLNTSEVATVSLTVQNQLPIGDFIFDPVAPEAKQAIIFFAAAQDPDGSITAYAWDLDGDGEFDDGASEEVSHVFSWGGTYTVRLRVTDDDGQSAIIDHAIAVSGDPPPAAQPTPNPGGGGGTGGGGGGSGAGGASRAPGDTTAPSVIARVARQPLDTVRSKGLAMTLLASEACSVKVSLEVDKATARKLKLARRPRGNVVVGTAQPTLVGPQTTARVRLTAKARRALGRARSVKLRIALAATDSAGNTAHIAAGPVTLRE